MTLRRRFWRLRYRIRRSRRLRHADTRRSRTIRYRALAFFNRRWVKDRWLWLQWLHCRLSRQHFCRYCVTVGCAWCQIKVIRVIDARKPESGWKYSAEKGWACPACHEAIMTALNWEPVKPTDDYES